MDIFWSYYITNIFKFMIKFRTIMQAIDLLEDETVIRDEELKDRLKKVCFSELETIKNEIEKL